MRFYIYAGSNEQARTLARAMDLARDEWKHLHTPNMLRGVRGGVILLYGTWWERPEQEVEDVRWMARYNHMTVLTVTDKVF